MMHQVVRIDFNIILETLQRGIHRADIFMGIGMNAAEQQPPISHVLAPDGRFHIELVKQNLSEDERAHVAVEFGKWVTSNGLRELIETFSIFLHQIYTALHVMHVVVGKEIAVSPRRFERMGVGDQIAELQKIIPILEERVLITRSLNQARNCYAHRNGRVGLADVDAEAGEFSLTWLALSTSVREPDGNVIPESEMFGRLLPAGGTVLIEVVIKTRAFRVGDELTLTKTELKEICLCVNTIGAGILDEAQKFGLEAGVILRHGEVTASHPAAIE